MEPDVPTVANQADQWFSLFLLQYKAWDSLGLTQWQLILEMAMSSGRI